MHTCIMYNFGVYIIFIILLLCLISCNNISLYLLFYLMCDYYIHNNIIFYLFENVCIVLCIHFRFV